MIIMNNYYYIDVIAINNRIVQSSFITSAIPYRTKVVAKKVPFGYIDIRYNIPIYDCNVYYQVNDTVLHTYKLKNKENLQKIINKKGSILITNSNCNKPIKVNNEELVTQYFHSYEYSKFKNMIKNFYLKDLVNRKKYFNYLKSILEILKNQKSLNKQIK